MAGSKNYGRITSLDELKRLIEACWKVAERGQVIGFDIETGYSGPDRKKGALDAMWDAQFIAGFSVGPSESLARYIPVAHDLGDNLPEAETWELMKPLLETGPIVAHNAKFEKRNLRSLERKGRGPAIEMNVHSDTMILGYVLSEWKSTGLKGMVKAEFDHQMTEITELFPGATAKALESLRFNVLDLTPDVVNYGCEDSAWCVALHNRLYEKAKSLRPFMLGLETQIVDILADMEDYGVAVDWEGMETSRRQAAPFFARVEKAVKDSLGEMSGQDTTLLNLNSPKQIKELLYRDLGLATTRVTKGADDPKNADKESWEKMSTDSQALSILANDYPVIRKLLDMREVKNLSARLDKWVNEYGQFSPDERVHPNFAQTIVGSGRFAANDPPIQQCPKDWHWTSVIGEFEGGENGKEFWSGNFRDFVCSRPGTYLLTYDYSQVELRVLAGVSKEPALMHAFNADADIHTVTAAMMLKKAPEDVDPKKERPIGKTMNFALLYGMGPKSMAERLAITKAEAMDLYESYFEGFPSITSWMDKQKQLGTRNGFVETHFGRKITIWELASDNPALYSKGERLCVNAPIQGGAADYMKIAMVRVAKEMRARGWWKSKVTMIMNQHDSLSFEVSNDLDPQEVRDALESCVVFPVAGFPKIVADWEMGARWGSSTAWKSGMVTHWDGEGWQLVTSEDAPGGPIDRVPAPVPVAAPAAPQEPAQDASEAAEYVVEMSTMPTSEGFLRFMALMDAHPGSNTIALRTPEGEVVLEQTCGLSEREQGSISMALGGARIFARIDTSNVAVLAADIHF